MFVAVDAMPYRARGTFFKPWLRFVARATLALLAMWTLHLAQNRFTSFEQNYSSTFHYDIGLWLGWVGTSAGAGFLFGLAVLLPFSRVRFLWSRLLLAALALLPVVQFWSIWGYLLPRRHAMSGWFITTSSWFDGAGAQLALTVLAGVAIASGFRAKNPEPGSSPPVSEGFDPET
jgi:hypothetical protein